MAPDDRLYLPDPVYHGGTVERTRGSRLAGRGGPRRAAATPSMSPSARQIGDALLAEARDGDRIVIMGARDDTPERIRRASWSSGSRRGTDAPRRRWAAHGQSPAP